MDSLSRSRVSSFQSIRLDDIDHQPLSHHRVEPRRKAMMLALRRVLEHMRQDEGSRRRRLSEDKRIELAPNALS